MAKKISVVIVSYNVCQLLDECLASVERALEGIEGDIFVVDNDSTDGTVATLQPKHPGIVFEKVIVDCGGYQSQYLFGQESPCRR